MGLTTPDDVLLKNLRPETMGILAKVEALSGRPVEFKPDSSLGLRATLQIARNGSRSHVLRHRPSNDPIDYWVAYQAGFVLRLSDLSPVDRFDFAGTGLGPAHVEALLTTGQPLTDASRSGLPQFAEMIVQWAMLNLRSYAICLRIDRWLATEYPSLRADQDDGMDAMQQENLALLSNRFSGLSVPVSLLAPVAAYALFADRLLGRSTYAIPYRAAGVVDGGAGLLAISDALPTDPDHDRQLVDAWASAIGMTGWYAWTPYKP